MKYYPHIKFWLGKIIYFLLCYAMIVGTFYCLTQFTVESMRWTSGPDQHVFPIGVYDKYDCVIVLLLSALVISEIGLCLLRNYFSQNKLIQLFAVIYLGSALHNISWISSHHNPVLFMISNFAMFLIAIQFLRYQFLFIKENHCMDLVSVLLVFWPFLFFMIAITYEDVYDQFVKGDDYAEAIFAYGVPMFFVYPVLFPLERRKVVSLLCSAIIMLSFLILSNVEIIRFIMDQQFSWQHFTQYWLRSLSILLILVAPVMLVPRLLYWGYHRYFAKPKLSES